MYVQVYTVNPIDHCLQIRFGTTFVIPLKPIIRVLGGWIPDSLNGVFRFPGYPKIGSSKKLMSTISYTQPYPSKQHSTSIQGQQIGMSILDTSHSHLAITPGDKFHDQWIVILLMQKSQKSTTLI